MFPVAAYVPKGSIIATDEHHWVVRKVSLKTTERERKIFFFKCTVIAYYLDANINMYVAIFTCKKRPILRRIIVNYLFKYGDKNISGKFILSNKHVVILSDVTSEIQYEIITYIRYFKLIKRILSRAYKKGTIPMSDYSKIEINKFRYSVIIEIVKL